MKDYYSILGVSPSATDDEIKAAYRELARKYHPDNYKDNPLASLAEEKMKDINEAYEEIQKQRKNGSNGGYRTSGSYNSGGYSSGSYNSGSYNTSSGSPIFAEIRQLINQGRIDEAQNRLNSVSNNDRTAEWYFLMGAVNYRRGYMVDARRYFETAVNMDPNNMEYRQALNNMNANVYNYGGYRAPRSGGGACDICLGLCCADSCCECMGGDLISCC